MLNGCGFTLLGWSTIRPENMPIVVESSPIISPLWVSPAASPTNGSKPLNKKSGASHGALLFSPRLADLETLPMTRTLLGAFAPASPAYCVGGFSFWDGRR